MLSDYAYRTLNDPDRIARREIWFRRLEDLIDSRPNEYNSRYVFTVMGEWSFPIGPVGEYTILEPQQLKQEFDAIIDSLSRIGPRAGEKRLAFFRDMISGSHMVENKGGIFVQIPSMAFSEPERWTEEALEIMAQRPECTDNRFAPKLVPFHIYGVQFVNLVLGANVYYKHDQWYADYLKTPVGELQYPDLVHNKPWNLVQRSARAFVEADVKLPLFCMPTLSSALNILINLYGQDALIAMMEDEESVRHDLKVINDVIRMMHRWFRENVPLAQLQCVASDHRIQPPGAGQLDGCSTQLVSGEMYREYIMPLDDALLGDYPRGGMIHLCGAHTQHIPAFREMKHLRAVQLNDRASWDLAEYLNGLREDQVVYCIPCEGMPLEKAVSLSRGKRLIIVGPDNAPEL